LSDHEVGPGSSKDSSGALEWDRLERVFFEALAVPPDERDAVLDRLCQGEDALRSQVAAMLAAEQHPRPFRFESGDLSLAEAGPSKEGTRIGHYRLLELLGRGGMGDVYLAERADGAFERKVAVKLLRHGLDGKETEQRFEAERQILANLDHPNIARLLDGGSTEDHLPYLVLQLVEGRPLTTYCDEHRLSIDQRLRLFVTLGRAIQFAHLNLVAHLDLKPSNILVTDAGDLRVLDFGISRLLGAGTDRDATSGQGDPRRVLTPDYAAPEQFRGELPSAAADVYSLGVILHELVCGRRPRRGDELPDRTSEVPLLTSVSTSELDPANGLSLVEPAPTGRIAQARGARPERLRARLRGDLDHIVAKALRDKPTDRYGSAGQLVEDVERHLAHLPVRARSHSVPYRMARYVRRNRRLAVATALLFATITGLGGVATVQARIAAVERDRAEAEAERSEEVVDVLVGLFASSNPRGNPGLDTFTVAGLIQNIEQEVLADLQDRPGVLARLQYVLGQIRVVRGQEQEAAQILSQALKNQRLVSGEEDPHYAAIIHTLALSRRRTSDAEVQPLLDKSIELHERVFGDPSPELSSALLEVAWGIEDAAARSDMVERATKMKRELIERGGDVTALQVGLAEALNAWGGHYYRLGRRVEARDRFAEALETVREAYGADHFETLQVTGNLAIVTAALGDLEEAARLRLGLIEARRRLIDGAHPSLANDLGGLANLRLQQGRFKAADSLFVESVGMWRIIGETYAASGLSGALYNLALARWYLGEPVGALSLIDESIAIREARDEPGTINGLAARSVRAALIGVTSPVVAVDTLRALIGEMTVVAPPEGAGFLADAQGTLGRLLVDLGPLEEAEQHLRAALEFRERNGASEVRLRAIEGWLGIAAAQRGDLEEATEILTRASAAIEGAPLVLRAVRERFSRELEQLRESR